MIQILSSKVSTIECLALVLVALSCSTVLGDVRPNILVAISDDQSFPHASAYGEPEIKTPGFDRVARQGMLFHSAMTPAPGCSPMRAAFLTGRYIWEIGAAGTHASHFPAELRTFPAELENAGYRIGYTGKPWGPGRYQASGRQRNPAGPAFSKLKNQSPKGISATDYAGNFAAFLDQSDQEKPFCFWFGGHEPHRSFDKGIGVANGINKNNINVPKFLPDEDEIRSDLADYFYEIQWFDRHLDRMLDELENRGMLENTLVVVTSDNGMSFPRAKANVYEYGIHMPLAISLPSKFPGNQQSQDVVNLIDVTATIYDVAGVQPPKEISGQPLSDVLSGASSAERTHTYSARERHSSSRYNSLSYPQRCIRTKTHLLIKNYAPERWPAGAPQKYQAAKYSANGELLSGKLGPMHGGYHDIDACPSLSFLIANISNPLVNEFLQRSVAKRPAIELYDIQADPACLENLADSPSSIDVREELLEMLTKRLTEDGDLREIDFANSHVWESYPRYSSLRWFPKPDWANETTVPPRQEWLEKRRPTQ
ncbi:MAG: sulfatase [Aureliella sp.]